MSEFEPIPVRFTVFREEYPALYDYIASLPNSRQRKRNAFLRAMEVGANALLSGLPPTVMGSANGALPAQAVVPSIESTKGVSNSVPDVVIDPGDLTELFG
jgi:hypothetical protein